MNAAMLAELEIEKSLRDRAKAGREVGGKATQKQKEDRLALTSDAKRSEPKGRQPRAEEKAAKTAKVSTWKVKQAIAVHKAGPRPEKGHHENTTERMLQRYSHCP